MHLSFKQLIAGIISCVCASLLLGLAVWHVIPLYHGVEHPDFITSKFFWIACVFLITAIIVDMVRRRMFQSRYFIATGLVMIFFVIVRGGVTVADAFVIPWNASIREECEDLMRGGKRYDLVTGCYANLAVRNLDPSFCRAISDRRPRYWREDLHLRARFRYPLQKFNADPRRERSHCFLDVAIAARDPGLCQRVTIDQDRARCANETKPSNAK